jgi:hypothetical protein
MKSLVLLFAFIALTAAQQRCVDKKTFVANISLTSNELDGPRRGMYHGEITLYYDAEGQRVRTDDIFFRVPVFNTSLRMRVYDFYPQKERYRYNIATKQCTKEALQGSFVPIEVPPEARYLGEQEIGVEGMIGNSVRVDLWAGNSAERRGAYSMLFTIECVPVLDFFNSVTDWRHSRLVDCTSLNIIYIQN